MSAVGCFWMPTMTAGLPMKPASPRFDACRELDLRDLTQQNALALLGRNDQVAQIFEPVRDADVADQILARVLIDEPATRVGAEATHGGLDVCWERFPAAPSSRGPA